MRKVFFLVLLASAAAVVPIRPSTEVADAAVTPRWQAPLVFVADSVDGDARLFAHSPGFAAAFERDGVTFRIGARAPLRLRFVDASAEVDPGGGKPQPGRVSWFKGKDPSRWKRGLRTFGEVVYRELWPGIDLVFRGRRGELKYEFHVRPGARVDDISLEYVGQQPSLDDAGAMHVGEYLVDEAPRSFQGKTPVDSRFVLDGAEFGFAVGAYDPARTLIIDPGFTYSTFLGASHSGSEEARSVAVDRGGNTYVVGYTRSTGFPVTPGAFDTTYNDSTTAPTPPDVFVTKLSADGSTLIYSTFVGGTARDLGFAVDIDSDGNAYVVGRTESTDFPATTGALDTTFNGVVDAFAFKLSADGTALAYATYLGGTTRLDTAADVAVGPGGDAYIVGTAGSSDFPTTAGAFDRVKSGTVGDAFIARLDATGSALVFSTFLGGTSGGTDALGLALDSGGNVVVTGATLGNFPVTPGAFQSTPVNPGGNRRQGYLAKLTPDGATLLAASYFSGNGWDIPYQVALDADDNAHIVGFTSSTDLPITPGAFDTASDGDLVLHGDGFAAKLDADFTTLTYATYLGGSGSIHRGGGNEVAFDAAIDPLGRLAITGWTDSDDFPTTANAVQPLRGGEQEGFLTVLDPAGAPVTSTYLGGAVQDIAQAVAVDDGGGIYVAGRTSSSDFPTAGRAFDPFYNLASDVFVTRFGPFGTGDLFSHGGGRIWRIDADDPGNLEAIGSCAMSGFGASFDCEGNLYVGETDGLSIYDRNFQLLGSATTDRIFFPVVRRPGQVIGCNPSTPSKLLVFDTTDLANPVLTNTVTLPISASCRAMAFDAWDRLWIAAANTLIRLELDAAGNITGSATWSPGGNPFGLAIQPGTGRIFYAAVGSKFIGVVEPDDPATRVATIENVGDTTFSLQTVAFDSAGNLFAGCRAVDGALTDVVAFPAAALTDLAGTVDASDVGGIPFALHDFGRPLANEGLLLFKPFGKSRDPITVDAGPNLVILSEDQPATVVGGTASSLLGESLACRWLDGTTVVAGPAPVTTGTCPLDLGTLPLLGVGSHTLTLEVEGCALTLRDTVVITVENSPPTAAPSGGGIFQLNQAFTVGGSVADFDGDALSYEWRHGTDVLASGVVATVAGGDPVALPDESVAATSLGVGVHSLELAVDDGVNDEVVESITVTIIDADIQPPTCDPEPSVTILWPPNHELVPVTIDANAIDDSGEPVTIAVAVAVTDASTNGDNTDPDFIVDDDGNVDGIIRLRLRSERAGRGDGRTYTVTITVTDTAGNSATCEVEIRAPHSQGSGDQ